MKFLTKAIDKLMSWLPYGTSRKGVVGVIWGYIILSTLFLLSSIFGAAVFGLIALVAFFVSLTMAIYLATS